MLTATAIAHANIAFIKYWGNRDEALRLPSNNSISMNLANLDTRTRVTFNPNLKADTLTLNQIPQAGSGLERVSDFLARVRALSGVPHFAAVHSENNFPMGAGIASSASAFAALSLAASAAAGLTLNERELSRLARTGSGSACRSIPAGFVEWQQGTGDSDSYALSIAPPDYWHLADCVAITCKAHKTTGSTEGHALASTSPLQQVRVSAAPQRVEQCRSAILNRDFAAFAEVVELDSNLMHAVMMTSTPPLLYWQAPTLNVMHAVRRWREEGTPVCYTIDAGPNVHVLTPQRYAQEIEGRLRQLSGVEDVLVAAPGGAAQILQE
ncbi:MAG: diphosphomevalonate decarboxylase [Anaerolineaceae bacterium 4572_5.1]|nr:MAG: diphosphomevalonate decarboxylase [Anaerolineaceae bacterium 4572_5.1]